MISLLVLAALTAFILLSGAVYQAIGSARDRRDYPPPGRLVDVGGNRLHIFEAGEGGPAVVLEAGIAASSLSWSRVLPEVAKFARVCSYDRAGLGWSEASPRARSAAQCAEELRALLDAAGIAGPYVLVGHSFGGCVVRIFASRHPQEVAGVVLVDALHPNEWLRPNHEQRRMIKGGALFSYFGAFLARVGVVRFCLKLLRGGATWFPRLFVRSLGTGVSSTTSRIVGEVRKLPPEVLPQVAALWCQPKCFRSMAAHLLALPATSAQVAASSFPRDAPLIVLSANNLSPQRLRDHQEVAALSARGKHLVAVNSGHWIHLDQPELVVHAIREIVEATRGAPAQPRPS
jgi:pimeloyl-ACP methyl ester carboxylesterase